MECGNNGISNKALLAKVPDDKKRLVLNTIAKHYGISEAEALEEVTNDEAEDLLEYLIEPVRTEIVLIKRGMK